MTDTLFLDATDQLKALLTRQISARELLNASAAQTNALHARLNAVVSRDLDRAHDTAKRIDDRRARGESLGSLAGLPMTVKDALDVEGLPASAGVKRLLARKAEDFIVIASIGLQNATER